MARRRNGANHASVRSTTTTHLRRPVAGCSRSRHGRCGAGCDDGSVPDGSGGTASTTASSIRLSRTFAPVSFSARGMPFASVRTWRFVPGSPRSVGIRPVAALLAAIGALSRDARLKSMPFWRPSRSRSACCGRSHTSAFRQSRKRRQQVIPEPQPISRGSNSQGVPERGTNKIPVSARGRRSKADRPSTRPGRAAEAVRSRPTGHREGAISPSYLNVPTPVLSEALSGRLVATMPEICAARQSKGGQRGDDVCRKNLRRGPCIGGVFRDLRLHVCRFLPVLAFIFAMA